MKKRSFIKYSLVVAVIGVATLGSYQIDNKSLNVGTLFLDNVEALAQSEQPTPNCVKPASTDCISLHPTDPSKDITVKNARWAN